MSDNPATPALRVASATRAPFRILRAVLIAVAVLLAISSVMSPRPALAEDVHCRHRVRLNVWRPGETSSGWTDWISPSAKRDFSADELWWHVYSVLGTEDVRDIIAANGLAGEHPANGTQEDITFADGKGRARYTSSLIGTLKVSDGEHGTGSVVSEDIGPVGEVTTTNPRVFAERIRLSATPDAGYEFDSWEFLSNDFGLSFDDYHDPSTWLNTGITTTNIEVKPTFKALPTQPVTVTDDGHGTGSASMGEAWDGATVTLSATPSDGWDFDRWVVVSPEGLAIDGDSFVMGSEPVTIKATFKEAPKVLPASGGTPAGGDGAATGNDVTEDAVTEDTPGQPADDATRQDTEGTKVLPATGDATLPAAIGGVVIVGACIAVVIRQRS